LAKMGLRLEEENCVVCVSVHQVLMRMRSESAYERLQATAVVAGLVRRLSEEYLMLLPEALPFLAELLEDPEPPVEAAAQALLAQLEQLSGESLEQYLQK
jgi:U3 small nucleolar RNA-associated protein 10